MRLIAKSFGLAPDRPVVAGTAGVGTGYSSRNLGERMETGVSSCSSWYTCLNAADAQEQSPR